MTLDVVYLLVVLPAIAIGAGLLMLRSTQRDAARIRAAEAERARAATRAPT